MPPKVSVIIPAFNAEQFITASLNSVLDQRYSSNIEIIVIDDGSSDNTRLVVSEMAQHHPQIQLLKNNRKKGPSGARNVGLLNATGDYIAFLDADDLWLPNHLENGLDFLEKNEGADIVFYNFEVHNHKEKEKINDWFSMRKFLTTVKSEELPDDYFLIRDDMFNSLIDEMFIHLQSMIVRRDTVDGILFNEEIKRSEDRDFSIRLHLNSKARFAFKNLVTGIYYRHSNSLTTRSVENSLLTILDQIKLFSEYLILEGLDDQTKKKLKKILFDHHLSASYHYRQLSRHKHALTHCLQSYRYRVSLSQLKELGKIFVSLASHNMRQLSNENPIGANR